MNSPYFKMNQLVVLKLLNAIHAANAEITANVDAQIEQIKQIANGANMQEVPYASESSALERRNTPLWVGEFVDSTLTPQQFLLPFPLHPYTVLRTINHRFSQDSIKFHCGRLNQSLHLIEEYSASSSNNQAKLNGVLAHSSAIETRAIDICRVIQSELNRRSIQLSSEEKLLNEYIVTIVVSGSQSNNLVDSSEIDLPENSLLIDTAKLSRPNFDLKALISHAPVFAPYLRDLTSVSAICVPRARDIPLAKHSKWVTDREQIEKMQMNYNAGECILCKDGILLEGARTNLWVVTHHAEIITTPISLESNQVPQQNDSLSNGVLLNGYIRYFILKHADRLRNATSTDIKESTIHLKNIANWKEIFITGTGKIITPITRLSYKSCLLLKQPCSNYYDCECPWSEWNNQNSFSTSELLAKSVYDLFTSAPKMSL